MDPVSSFRALEAQQDNMERLLQQHRRSLAEHRVMLLKLLDGQAAVDAEMMPRRQPSSPAVTLQSTASHLSSSYLAVTPREEQGGFRTLAVTPQEEQGGRKFRASSETESSSDDEYLSGPRPVHAMQSILTNFNPTDWLEDDYHAPKIHAHSRLQRKLLDIVHSNMFELCALLLIMVNCLVIVLDVNVKLQPAMEGKRVDIEWVRSNMIPHPPWLQTLETLRGVDNVLLCFFVLENMFRLAAERQAFFCGPNMWWNLLDAVVTIVCLSISVKDYCSSRIDPVDRLRFVRILRLLRTLRMIRIFRPFRTLRVMLYSIVACLQSMLWAAFLLYCFVVTLAIYLQDVALYNIQVHNIMKDDGERPPGSWETTEQQLREHWGDMFQAQFSLFLSVTGGADWGDLAAPFCSIHRFHCLVYVSWVVVVIFGLINITVGIYARQAQEFHKYDRHLIVEGALADHTSMRETLNNLFDRIDVDQSGWLSRKEIETALGQDSIRAYFAHLSIDIETNPDEFFRMLDEDGNDRVDRDEFAKTCLRLQGGAKPLELAKIVDGFEEMKGHLKEVHRATAGNAKYANL